MLGLGLPSYENTFFFFVFDLLCYHKAKTLGLVNISILEQIYRWKKIELEAKDKLWMIEGNWYSYLVFGDIEWPN